VARRRVYLNTVGHILQELGAQYRRADKGELEWADAVSAARVLREMRFCLETSDIEARIVAIEQLLQADGRTLPPGRPNGLGVRL
jgi:hypothetical protein